MEIVKGVNLHVVQTKKFKTNHITFRFSTPLKRQTLARRALIAQLLETANAKYPNLQVFRQQLAHLYGATLSTKVSTKGKVHVLDIDINFVSDPYSMGEEILVEIFDFLFHILFNPLVSVVQYQQKFFNREKANLLHAISLDMEDSFIYSDYQAKHLFFEDDLLALPSYADLDLVEEENSYTVYQEFQKMLQEDQIDIFVVGDVDAYRIVQLVHQYPLEERQVSLDYFYDQPYTNVVKQKVEQSHNQQSVLQLVYNLDINNQEKFQDFSLLVLNGMFGSFSNSRLFTEVREKEGLSYHIGSFTDRFTKTLQVYAGIDAKDREITLRLIQKQLNDFKRARFSINLLEQTKTLLRNNLILLEDHQKTLVDLFYHQRYCGSQPLETILDELDKISKEDVVALANQIKLQAIYFLEGS
ncbi:MULTISPECIES: EF-P 5-aminopentanol modification-associated protein YfmF [unclassified Streptococcus]|uniref:EF-P 5-aminopentanol modification-associated protein YfmF n=1 Tax=unclassified Streptococcus TaxID=2608887 RepID=UPI0011B69A1B|nr:MULTISPECIES: pitrilysin family protein [unclassified Streptococcus]TWS94541.1 insulinase family protein [Streptococcus sp. sy018]TWT14389.1 insulinase family protein [Streptococcus sp. sy010]